LLVALVQDVGPQRLDFSSALTFAEILDFSLFCRPPFDFGLRLVFLRPHLIKPLGGPDGLGNSETCAEAGARLLQPRRPALPLAKHLQRAPKIPTNATNSRPCCV